MHEGTTTTTTTSTTTTITAVFGKFCRAMIVRLKSKEEKKQRRYEDHEKDFHEPVIPDTVL